MGLVVLSGLRGCAARGARGQGPAEFGVVGADCGAYGALSGTPGAVDAPRLPSASPVSLTVGTCH